MAQVTSKGVLGLVALLLKPMMSVLSPMIRDLVDESLLKLYAKAQATENPIDDLFVGFLLDILDIDVPE